MKGRKPQPSNVIPMKGAAPRHAPEAPEFLSEQGRKVWEELAPVMVMKDRLEPHHVYQFAAYCESVSNFIAATHALACEGMYYDTITRNGKQQKITAASRLQEGAMATMRQNGALFGLSPVDDARLKSGAQGDLFADVLDQLKNGTD
ncbi:MULTISPECIES: P27 family phage terminase small subunit [unclassified Yoonia]|uniref:P27 family phage terminase small subunit n=1 Tax=unclassified Yoonia TaxID=2629118 RepID=UPI002AFFDE06|nr:MULTISPECIES: P27 family phage terminase small subunit [unclassified Yoonia]